MKRTQSNIVNTAFTIRNQESEDSRGRKLKEQGVELTHATVNGVSAGVGFRTINGGQKSANIALDTKALGDLLSAVNEILADNEVN
jgi:hypothetical protein